MIKLADKIEQQIEISDQWAKEYESAGESLPGDEDGFEIGGVHRNVLW
jgi:hypothetical protein